MKSILVTYPNFRELPKGLKQMLLASESFFFNEMKTGAVAGSGDGKRIVTRRGIDLNRSNAQRFLHSSWRN